MTMKNMDAKFVQFGCGTCAPDGWLNFDASPVLRLKIIPLIGPILVKKLSVFPANVEFGDIVKGLPINTESAHAIYSCHVLEHLYKDECIKAIQNTYHYLKPGGVFRLVVPDISKLARAFLNDPEPEASIRFVGSTQLTTPARPKGIISILRELFGHSRHRWMWDFKALKLELEKAGFQDIREATIGDSGTPEFLPLEVPERYEYAVCIECIKPDKRIK